MSRLAVTKKKQKVYEVGAEGLVRRQKQMSAQISQTSGSTRFGSRDPVYHLMNSYINKFDAVGKQRAAQMNGTDGEAVKKEDGEPSHEARVRQLRQKHDHPMFSHSRESLERGSFADRFSAYAFNGGNMASAVMAGKGKQMFTACLSRALGRPSSLGEKQKKVIEQTAVRGKLDGTQAEVMFNRDAHSAVGIVLDTIRGASSTLEVFRKLANESGALKDTPVEHRDVDTVQKLYPFMVTAKDKALIKSYKTQLKALQGDNSQQAAQSRRTIEWALKKETAVLERKMAEQRRFLTVLNKIQSNVHEAEKLFSSDGFAESIAEELLLGGMDIPPEDDGSGRRNEPNGLDVLSALVAELIGSVGSEEKPLTGDESTSEELNDDAAAAEPNAQKQQKRAAKKASGAKEKPQSVDADVAGGGTGSRRR